MKSKAPSLILCLALCLPNLLEGHEIILPDEEAPATIFSSKIGDSDVKLEVKGTWKAEVTGSFGFSWDSVTYNPVFEDFPELTPGFLASQEPDITVSLRLAERYFFEASFIDDYDLNTFLLGYDGKEDEFLRSVRIGNTDLGISPSGYMSFSDASGSSLGASISFATEHSAHEIMVRYDPASLKTRSFSGMNEVTDQRVSIGSYIRGRFFALPSSGVSGLSVYVECTPETGDLTLGGRRYRKAKTQEASLSSEDGLITFAETQKKRIIATYDGIDWLGTDLGNGETMDNYQIDTSAYFILYEPGKFSPFELCQHYESSLSLPVDSSEARAYLIRKNSENTSDAVRLALETSPQGKRVSLAHEGTDPLSRANRRPFEAEAPGLYTPDAVSDPANEEWEILIQVLSAVTSFTIDDDALEGSVIVRRNGMEESGFTVNYDSGIVTLASPVYADDSIEISYRTEDADAVSGDLLFGVSNNFSFGDNLAASLGLGVRWNVFPDSFTTIQDESPGSIILSGGFSYDSKESFDGKRLAASLDAGLSLGSPDTTGRFRLAGMENSGYTVSISRYTFYPAAVSASTTISILASGRAPLIFKDYRSYDAVGSATLMHYTWTPPDDQIYSYTSGSIPGPYIAASGDEIDGQVGVMEYGALSAGDWAGAQIPLASVPDLSNAASVSFWVRFPAGVPANAELYLEAGRLSEDLDGDGVLDEEVSTYDSGFSFDDEASGVSLSVGGGIKSAGNGYLDTEDADGNEVLDSEGEVWTSDDFNTSTYLTSGSTAWKRITLDLSATDRAKLTAVSGLRLVLKATGSVAAGKLLVGQVHFAGSAFSAKTSSGSASVREMKESEAHEPPARLLEKEHSEVAEVFHPKDETQKVLEVSWSGTTNFTVTGYLQPVSLTEYKKLVFYFRSPAIIGGEMTLKAVDGDGRGVSVAFTPAASAVWQKAAVDLEERTLKIDGATVTASVDVDSSASSLGRLILEFAGLSASSGYFYLDEVHFSESVLQGAGGVRGSLSYTHQGALLSAWGRDIVSNLELKQAAASSSEGFGRGFTAEGGGKSYSRTDLSFSLLQARLSGFLALTAADGSVSPNGGTTLRLPLFASKLVLEDSFTQAQAGTEVNFSRKSGASFSPVRAFSLSAENRNSLSGTTLAQEWEGKAGITPESPYTVTGRVFFRNSRYVPAFESDSYGKNWLDSYTYILPTDRGGLKERKGEVTLSQSLDWDPLGFRLPLSLSYRTYGTSATTLAASGSGALSLPLSLAPGLTLTPSYGRAFASSELIEDKGFGGDMEDWASSFQAQGYIYRELPIIDLFSDKTAERFTEESRGFKSASYTPSLQLSFSRVPSSYIRDLFIPATAELSLNRSLVRSGDTVNDSFDTSLSLRARAMNLFGRMGSHPAFDFYSTDDIANTLSVSANADGAETDTEFTWKTSVDIFGNREERFLLESSLSYASESAYLKGESLVTLRKKQEAASGFIPFLSRFEKEPYFLHTETLSLSSLLYPEDGNGNKLSIVATHETRYVLSENARIGFHVSPAFSVSRYLSGNDAVRKTNIGIEGGLHAALSF